jgi:hypothetical protein
MKTTLSDSRVGTLSVRIMRLERQNRQLRWFGAASFLGLLILTALGSAWGQARLAPAEKVIRAENFVAVDGEGRGVIGIGTNIREKMRGAIEFLDKSGKPRMTMGLGDDDSPFVILLGQDGRDQIALEARVGKGLGISFRDTKRDSGLMIGTNPEGVAALGFIGKGGKLIWV